MLKKKKQKSATVVAKTVDYNGLCGAVDQRNHTASVRTALADEALVAVRDKAAEKERERVESAEATPLADEPEEAAIAKTPSLTDACSKCGRELGEHDGKKCPKAAKQPKVKAPAVVVAPAQGPLILGYKRHPAAALYPMCTDAELDELAADISDNGLLDDIILIAEDGEDWILDGSNRGVACERAKVKPRFERYNGKRDMATLVAFVVSKNGHRRHLTPSVRAMIAADAAQLGRGNPGNRETGRSAGLMSQGEAGKKLGVSERLVRKAVSVRDNATAKVKDAVMKGRLTVEAADCVAKLPAAKQDEIADKALAKSGGEIKSGHIRALVRQEEKRAVVRKINEQGVPPAPIASYRLIVIDNPWPYDNSDQHDGSRGHITYPPMPMEDICRLRTELDRLAHADECVLGMWVTNAFIHEVGRVLTAWGFTHRTMFTWDKVLEGVGTWGRGRTEHLVIASRGNVVHTLNEISTLLEAKRREHSRKPDEMYELLAKHCPGPRIDMFAREQREGWATWGAETEKFATEAA